MTFLFSVLILIGLGLYGLKEYYQIKTGVIPVQTHPAAISALVEYLQNNTSGGAMLDLGSGYGRRVLALAKDLPEWEITGVEQSPTPWIIANLMTVGKNFGNYRFFMTDPMTWSLRDYDLILLHQTPQTLKKWEASIARRLQPGTTLICYQNGLPRIKPVDTLTLGGGKFYVYRRNQNEAQDATTS